MRFSVISLFPDIIQAYCQTSIVGRAQKAGLIQLDVINPRDFAEGAHRKVDDSPYGGGSGMVMLCEPLDKAYQSLQLSDGEAEKSQRRILLTSPTGRKMDQAYVQKLAKDASHIVLFCGHYEGIDHRIQQLIPETEEVSIGDFVLTGGELPALCVIDAVSRMLPGVVQKFTSVESDSFYNGLLDYPHYTRPAEYKGIPVPEVLLSGNHEAISTWRRRQSIERTWRYRPDLLESIKLTPEESNWIHQLDRH